MSALRIFGSRDCMSSFMQQTPGVFFQQPKQPLQAPIFMEASSISSTESSFSLAFISALKPCKNFLARQRELLLFPLGLPLISSISMFKFLQFPNAILAPFSKHLFIHKAKIHCKFPIQCLHPVWNIFLIFIY